MIELLIGGALVALGFVGGAWARKWQSGELDAKVERYRALYEEMCLAAGVTPTDPDRATVHRFRVFKRKNPTAKAAMVYGGESAAAARRAFEGEHVGGDEVVELWDGKNLRGKKGR